MRLAQTLIEQLRGFDRLASASGHLAHADLASGSDSPTAASDASFERRWTVSQPSSFEKQLRVDVGWTDRHGQSQQGRLATLLASVEPADSGALTAPPAANGFGLPAHALPPVPGAAHSRGRALSGLQRPGSGSCLVFDAAQGRTISRCVGTVTTRLTAANVCSPPFEATVVSGSITGLPPGFDSDARAAALALELAPGHSAADVADCIVSRVPVDGPWPRQPGAPAPASSAGARYHCACLVTVALPGGHWSGELRIAPRAGSLLRTHDRFCALSWEHDGSGTHGDAIDEHPLAYAQVQRSLGVQNFLLQPRVDADTPAPCPADGTVNGRLVAHLPLPAL